MSDTVCSECGGSLDEGTIVSGKGVWCSINCWEEWHGQPWPDKEGLEWRP